MPQKRPEDVFTPRDSRVNRAMYVERPTLEERFRRALRGKLHLVLHGESGTGKSWLYKKVFDDLGAHVVPLNLANAARLNSITEEMKSILAHGGHRTLQSYSEKKAASADALVARGSLEHQNNYNVIAREPFEECCALVRAKAGRDRLACIVLDNLEQIFDNPSLMGELANLLILVDDERYASYDVKLLIVGVPTGIRDYFGSTPARVTVANRLYELPEVGRLTVAQAADLIRRGFVDELGYDADPDVLARIIKRVSFVTDRVPQRIQEYCLELAMIGEEAGRTLLLQMLVEADRAWLRSSLSSVYSVIEALMNERETRIGRRNQAIYVIGCSDKTEFRYSDVEEMIRAEFPGSTNGVTIDCSSLLSQLESTEAPILRRTPKGDSYQFADPKYRMCIRAMLHKDPGNEGVRKVAIADLGEDL